MDDLTKEQQRFIIALYKEYLDRKLTMANEKAKSLPDAAYIQEHIFPAYNLDEIRSICSALRQHGYITCKYYDNTVFFITITDKTIVYMENRFSNGLKEVVNFLINFIP